MQSKMKRPNLGRVRCLPSDCPVCSIQSRCKYSADRRWRRRRRLDCRVANLSSVITRKGTVKLIDITHTERGEYYVYTCVGGRRDSGGMKQRWRKLIPDHSPIWVPFSWIVSCRWISCWPFWWQRSGPCRLQSCRKWPNIESPFPD